jgi:PAS domain S-box-containing protein
MTEEYKGTVLVVDDEPANLGVLFEYLSAADYKVLVAENGRSAIERFSRSQPDALLLDIKMPDMDGFEVYRQLQEKELVGNTVVIFLSVLSEADSIVRGFSLNAVDYITKPFQPVEVLARLEKHLTLRNLRIQLELQKEALKKEISDRKQAEKEREATQQLMQTTLDGMSDPVVLIGTDYHLLWANKAMRDMHAPDGEIISQYCYQLSHKRDKPCDEFTCACPLKQVRETRQPTTVVHQHIREDGEVRHLEIVASPLIESDGSLAGIVEATRDITDRIRSTEALRRYEHIVSATSDHMSFIDENYTYIAVNDAYSRAHLLSKAEIVGYTVPDLLGNQIFEDLVKENLDKALAGNEIRYQAWFDFKGPGRLFMDVVYQPYVDPRGNILGVVVSARDLTERIEIDKALKKSERSLAKAQQVAKVGHYEWDLNTNSTSWSIELYRIFGLDPLTYTPEANSFRELVHPEDVHLVSVENANQMVNIENHELEFRVIDQSSGEIKYIHLWGESSFDKSGAPRYIFGIIQDITERVRASEAIKESEELHRITIETMPDPVFITDDDGKFVYICPNIIGALGYSTEEIKAMGVIQSLVGEEFFDVDELRQAGEIHNIECRILDKTENRHDYLITIKEVDVKGGTCLFIFHDITAQNRANEARMMLASIEERRRLASDLHDSMTQSLHSLKLNSETALHLMEIGNNQVLQKTLLMLDQSAQQAMNEMRLLLYGLRLTPDEGVDLFEILNTRLEMVEQRLGLRAELDVDGLENIPPHWQSEIFYISMEALNNTLKHACAEDVKISLVANPYALELSIQDDGCGFEENEIDHMGMGIPNMVERAERLGGELIIDSHLGGGTTVSLDVDFTKIGDT